MTRWMRAPCVGHGHFPRAKWAIGKAVPQLNAVAMGPSDVAAGLPEQDELARSQLHGHGLRWAHQQSNAGLPPQCRTVAARLAKRARPKIRERKQALLGYPPQPHWLYVQRAAADYTIVKWKHINILHRTVVYGMLSNTPHAA